jgi:hypothetical protein
MGLAILAKYIKIEILYLLKRRMSVDISWLHTFNFGTLSSLIATRWHGKHSRWRWYWFWSRWLCFFLLLACPQRLFYALLAWMAAI